LVDCGVQSTVCYVDLGASEDWRNITSQTTLGIADWPYKPTRVFSACFVLTHTFTGKLLGRSPNVPDDFKHCRLAL